MLKKLLRYLVTGYIFQRKAIKKQLEKFDMPDLSTYKFKCKKKVAIYTVITGNYDRIKNPKFISENIDYFIVTDQTLPKDLVWKKIDIKYQKEISNLTVQELSRYYKIKPHELFVDYDYSIYIDGNIIINGDLLFYINAMNKKNKIIAMHKHCVRSCIYDEGKAIYALGKARFIDIFKQLNGYNKDGFPKNYGLFENNIIIRKHNDNQCIKLMNDWWNEYINKTHRDQLSFMYVLWKNGYTSDFVLSLGSNSRANPLFIINNHN